MAEATYPHVRPEQHRLIEKYGEHLNNTGGNDPADLLNDLQNPGTDERPNRLMTVNVVRFVLAVAVDSQLGLLGKLEREGIVAS